MHTRVQEAFGEANAIMEINAKIPRMHWFTNQMTSKFWDNLHPGAAYSG
jgi:hypothetical protein